MKRSSKKKRIDSRSVLRRIKQWNWRVACVVGVRFSLAAGVLFFLGMLVTALLPMVDGYYVDGITKFGGNIQADKTRVTVVYRFDAPRVDEAMSMNYSLADRNVVEVYAPSVFQSNANKFCLGEFGQIWERDLTDIQYGAAYRDGAPSLSSRSSSNPESPYGTGGFLKNECLDNTNTHGQRIDYANQTDEIILSGNSKFYFPYDRLAYEGLIMVVGTESSAEFGLKNVFLIPKVSGEVSAPNWDVKVSVIEDFNTGDDIGTRIRIDYVRPLLYRLLVPTMLLLMLGVIIALPLISETSTFLETLIGVVFGLWGLHVVLIPSDVTWPTIIDPLILSLYGLLGLSAILRVVVIPLWKKWEM
jgi:hypothetical protein